jgi:hypothetical protein
MFINVIRSFIGAGVLLASELDLIGDALLEILVDLQVVGADAKVVEVEELLHIVISAAGEFEDGQTDDFVVSGSKPLAVLILEVLLLDHAVQFGLK